MTTPAERQALRKPEISRFAFAMFDVLGFSWWLESVGLQTVLDSYHLLMGHGMGTGLAITYYSETIKWRSTSASRTKSWTS